MAFPVAAAVVGGILGIGQSILGGASQKAAADAQNAEQERIAKAQYKRSLQEYQIQKQRDMTQWYWDRARIEQLRFNEKQTALDQATYGAKLISSATENLAINSQALYDKFVTEERLRATQVGMDYQYTTSKLAADSTEAVRQYMQNINQTALQSNATVAKLTTDTQELLASLALEEQRDYLGWQLNVLSAAAKDSEVKAVASARQGGSNTSRKLAVQAAQQLGRTWAELDQRATSRDVKLGLLNSTMKNDVSRQLSQYALTMQDETEKIKYTNARYISDYGLAKSQMQSLTIPSFQLAEKQYGRELKSLQLQTRQAFDEATTKYREQTFFDPLKPVAGLRPKYIAPTAIAGPSAGSVIGNAILSGVSTAATFSDPKTWFK
jgi:hypothetical protein